ncbi:hypothetical protein CB1_000218009 [Camelus ferus]|nr:hypothetical protein CB1_000218009 [Camelus ferus]
MRAVHTTRAPRGASWTLTGSDWRSRSRGTVLEHFSGILYLCGIQKGGGRERLGQGRHTGQEVTGSAELRGQPAKVWEETKASDRERNRQGSDTQGGSLPLALISAKAVNPDGGTPLRTCNYRAGDCARTHASAASGEERTSEVYEDNYTR